LRIDIAILQQAVSAREKINSLLVRIQPANNQPKANMRRCNSRMNASLFKVSWAVGNPVAVRRPSPAHQHGAPRGPDPPSEPLPHIIAVCEREPHPPAPRICAVSLTGGHL